MNEYTKAFEKLEKESDTKSLNQIAKVVKDDVKRALLVFAKQEPEFAQAIAESSKTFTECLQDITKNIGNSISDIDLYRRAVSFYFDGASVEFEMKINLCSSVEGVSKTMHLSLFDLM